MSGVRIIIRNPPGGDLVELGTQYIYRGGWEVVQNAEEGSGGRSTLLLDDPDLSLWEWLGLNVGGRQQIRLVDVDSDRIVHFGFVGKRGIRRKYDDKGHPTGRAWSVDIWDVNSILQRRILTHKGADRPRESDRDRILALLTFPEWGIISKYMIGPSETTMSKHDYRGMTVGQYIGDCAQMARKNWWADVVFIDGADHQTFWYGRDSRSEYASTLSISNDLDDFLGSSTVFPPARDTEYTMDPERVFDGIWASGEKTSVYRRRPATAEALGLRWDTAQQWPTVHEKDRLIAKAESMLDRLKDEHEVITTAIEVPSTSAHLVRAGMRIPLKLTHVPTLAVYTDCRILSRGLQPISDGSRYRIPLTLEPIEPSDTVSCSTSLGGAISEGIGQQGPNETTASIDITPESDTDSVIIAGFMSMNSNTPTDTDLVAGGSATLIYQGNATGGDPLGGATYEAVSDPTGAHAMSATWTPGFGFADNSFWAAVALAVRTSATDPVQTKGAIGSGVAHAVFDDAVTPGNLLVIVAAIRGDTSGGVEFFPTTGWTVFETVYTDHVLSHSTLVIAARCIGEGDGDEYGAGVAGGGHESVLTLSEWEIT